MARGCPFVKKAKRSKKTGGAAVKRAPQAPRAPRAPRAKRLDDWEVRFFGPRQSSRKTGSELLKEKHEMLAEKVLFGVNESKMQIFEDPDNVAKGRCVRPTVSFQKGEFVLEYKGKMLPYKEAANREDQYSFNHNVGSFMYFFEYKGKKWCVDATEETKLHGRLINHSVKRPNLKTKTIEINGNHHLIFEATRAIRVGEELLYDYGDHSAKSVANHPWLINS